MDSIKTKEEPRQMTMAQLTAAIYDTSGDTPRQWACAEDNVNKLWQETFSPPNLVVPPLDFLKRISFPETDGHGNIRYKEVAILQKRVDTTVYAIVEQFDIDYWRYDIFTAQPHKPTKTNQVREGMLKLNEVEEHNFGPVLMEFDLKPHRSYLNDSIEIVPDNDCGC